MKKENGGKEMILSEKIVALRRQMGWSQEELASRLEVSRQSVSKWEVGAAIPDLDRILKISELFGVSTDYLLKDTMEEIAYSGGQEEPDGRSVSPEEAGDLLGLTRAVAGKIASAVTLFIVSPVTMLQLAALAEEDRIGEDMAMGIGVTVLLLLVVVGTALCIYHGMRLERFSWLEKEPFSLQYGVEGIVEKEKREFEASFRRSMVTGTVLCIVGVIPLILAGGFGMDDFACITCVSVLLVFVAAGANILVRAGMVQDSFNKLLQTEDYTEENKFRRKKLASFPGCYWLIVTAVYLGASFYTDRWDSTWIVWPVAGVLYAAVYSILKALVKTN